jgi:protein O-GlcNAc transferase
MRLLRRFLLVGLAALLGIVCHGQAAEGNGPESFALGKQLWEARNYDEAAPVLWRAVLLHGQTPAAQTYDVQEVFSLFMQCYMVQDRLADGLAYVSLESFRRGQDDMGATYLQQALQVDPQNEAALQIQVEFGGGGSSRTEESGTPLGALPGGGGGTAAQTTAATSPETSQDPFYGKTPEDLYEIASGHFANKEYEPCADIFELSCRRSGRTLGPSCSNAIYCRSMLVDWGFNGTQYEADMQEIVRLTEEESRDYKFVQADGSFVWKRSTSVHPHMMLGYPVDPLLKKNVAESVAFLDEIMARAERRENIRQSIPPLPADLPFRMDPQVYAQAAAENPQGKIRIGFVGSGFNSKAVLYLSQDMFRFFDKSRFEVHIFSFGPADNPLFIHHGMRGVDWRERIQANVDYFHDCQAMKMDHIKAARFIHDKDIHILMEWDGYARQGKSGKGLETWQRTGRQHSHTF